MNNGKGRKKDSARLVWDSKPRRAPNPKDIEFQTAEIVIPNPQYKDKLPLSFRDGLFGEKEIDKQKMNRLIWGDNLLAMQALLSQGYEGKINLIYIDPPFDSKADYSHKMTITPSPLAGEDNKKNPSPSGRGQGEGLPVGRQGIEFTKEPSVIERLAYKDTWAGGTDSYLDMLYPRLQLMKRLLAEDGSIYVHLDWHVGHYVKVMMDEIFGKENFLNEIIWKRADSHNDPSRLGIVDDRIYLYTKSEKYKFNPIFKEYSKNYLDSFYNHIEPETGRRYRLDHFTKPKGSLGYFYTYKSCEPPPNGWRCPIETMEKWDKMGILVVKGKRVYKKRYLDGQPGAPVHTIWDDISGQLGKEYTEFHTQKPTELLERILSISSNNGDLVADFFCGSGTTLSVAERLNRRWIGCELGKVGIQVARARLVEQIVCLPNR